MSRAYLCVSIATVCDRERGGTARQPPSFVAVTDGIVRRIQPLFERFGARPTYLLSRDVLESPACIDAFRDAAARVELGTHLDLDGSDERAALTDVTDLFIRAFDHQPQSFRAGAAGLGPASLEILESLGYAVDASMTPHMAGYDVPTQPYRPDREGATRGRGAAMLEVPVTIGRHPLSGLPGVGRRLGPRWLRPTRGTADGLVRVAEDEIAAARRAAPERPVILHAVLDNVDVVPAASPRGANEEEARGILDRLRALLVFARGAGIPVVGLADVPEILRR